MSYNGVCSYLYTALFEMKSSLIALGSNLLVILNICKAIRCITIFENGNMLSSLNKGWVYALSKERMLLYECFFYLYMCVWSITPNFNTVSEIRVYKRIIYKCNKHFLFKCFLALSKILQPFESLDFI